MRLIITLFLSILFLQDSALLAQKASIKWGPEEKTDKSEGELISLGWYDGFHYVFSRELGLMPNSNQIYKLQKIDESMKTIFTTNLKLKTSGSVFPIIVDDRLFVYDFKHNGVGYSTPKNKLSIICKEYDLKGKARNTTIIKEIFDFTEKYNSEWDYDFNQSPDKSKIVLAMYSTFEKAKKVDYYLGSIDLTEPTKCTFSSTNFELKDEENSATLRDIKILNSGEIISSIGLARRHYSGSAKKNDPYLYQIQKWSPNDGFLEPTIMKFEEVYIDKIEFEILRDNVFFTGFMLTRDGDNEQHNGFILGKYDLTANAIESINTFAYTTEFFESIGYKIKKDDRIKFSGYFDINIIGFENGGGYLLAEHIRNSYHYEEVLAIPFDPSGKLGDISVLLKKQRIINSLKYEQISGLGYFPFSRGDKLYIIYNDYLKNAEAQNLDDLHAESELEDSKNGTFIAELREGAPIEKSLLFTYKENKKYLIPDKCISEKGRTFIHAGEEGKKSMNGELLLIN